MSSVGKESSRSSDPAIEDAAAEWFVRRNAGLSSHEKVLFDAWLAEDARHAAALQEIEAAWCVLNEPRRSGNADKLARNIELRKRLGVRRRLVLVGVATAVAAASLALVFLPFGSGRQLLDSVPTVTVKPDRRVLDDSSVVELNAGAEIAVAYSSERRAVGLLQGEVLFEVAENHARPFVVTAGHVQVTAVGTAFLVRNTPEEVGVLVTEGSVVVNRSVVATGSGEKIHLEAGNRIVVPLDAAAGVMPLPEKVNTVQIEQALDWRGRRLEFNGTPLDEAIRLFNRYNHLQLTVRDPVIGELQLSGIFWSDDPKGFVRLLESGMNVRAERTSDSIILRSR